MLLVYRCVVRVLYIIVAAPIRATANYRTKPCVLLLSCVCVCAIRHIVQTACQVNTT